MNINVSIDYNSHPTARSGAKQWSSQSRHVSPRKAFRRRSCDEKKRQECCKANKYDEGGREEISGKDQTEVDGHECKVI